MIIHTYLGETLRFEIAYKNRRSMAISIDGYGNIELQVPKGTSEEQIIKAIEGKWTWITDKLSEMNERIQGTKEKSYKEGETFLYLGQEFPAKIVVEPSLTQDVVTFTGQEIQVRVKERRDEQIQQALKRFYYQQCKTLVEEKVRHYQRYFKVKPRSIRIADNNKTWGTCDSQHRLTFNWRLAMAPPEVIEYVVVHEMCHMVHLNHDRSFWRLVGSISPHYKQQEHWLALSNWKMTV